MDWLKEFQNPPSQYRIKPFWFWNGDMKKDEIDRQIQEMADKGLGGAFICARQGLKISYLSQEWFERVEYASRKAEEHGLETWLYDEYPYPSGMAGGEVLLRHPGAEHMVLHHRSWNINGGGYFEKSLGWEEILCAVAFPVRDGQVCHEQAISLSDSIGSLQREEIYQTTGLTEYNKKRFFTYRPEHILKYCFPEGDWTIEIYTQAPLGDFKYYGGFFDPCNKEAVKEFLTVTHEQYKTHLHGKFGSTVKGMFSDEVGLLGPIPWSKRLPEYFKEKRGYDILPVLFALHDSSYPNAYAIRYDLYRTIHQLFVESYHKQVSEWCRENHLDYATEVPSMRMTTQRFSSIVGGDTAHEKLGKSLEWIYDRYLCNYRSNAKSVSSLTRQLGNKYAMIESFHSVGWSMTIQDAKWMFDRLAASGINFYNIHAFSYTIASLTKHDAPPSQFLQNPYWKHYRLLADYVGRLGAWVTNTEADIHVAVLDPVVTLWAYLANPFSGFPYEGEDEREKGSCDYYRNTWIELCKSLLFHQIDYEHLDAEMLMKAEISDGEIRIGRAVYWLLILPPMKFMESGAYLKIREFADRGGKILCVEELPQILIDKDETPISWDDFAWNENVNLCFVPKRKDIDWNGWCRRAADLSFGLTADVDSRKDMVTSVRVQDESYYVFLANQGSSHAKITVEPLKGKKDFLYEFFLETGEVKLLKSMNHEIALKPFESRLLCYSDKRLTVKEVGREETDFYIIRTEGELPVWIEGKNIFRLDAFQISRDNLKWHPVAPKTFIEQCGEQPVLTSEDYQLAGAFGIPKTVSIRYPMDAVYKVEFYVEKRPEEIFLLMDQGAIEPSFEIHINDGILRKSDFEKFCVYDHNNLLCDISSFIKEGENVVLINIPISKDSDGIRDPLYLYGDFGVAFSKKHGAVITETPAAAALRFSYIEGFPYYSGTFHFITHMNLRRQHEKFELTLDVADGCHDCVEVRVNQTSLGTRAFAPYIWKGDSSILKDGDNEIEICLTNTLSHMLEGSWFDYDRHCTEYI